MYELLGVLLAEPGHLGLELLRRRMSEEGERESRVGARYQVSMLSRGARLVLGAQ